MTAEAEEEMRAALELTATRFDRVPLKHHETAGHLHEVDICSREQPSVGCVHRFGEPSKRRPHSRGKYSEACHTEYAAERNERSSHRLVAADQFGANTYECPDQQDVDGDLKHEPAAKYIGRVDRQKPGRHAEHLRRGRFAHCQIPCSSTKR